MLAACWASATLPVDLHERLQTSSWFSREQDAQTEVPEDTYQASFDTVPGEWTTVYIPW
jgi:hypothetical protein